MAAASCRRTRRICRVTMYSMATGTRELTTDEYRALAELRYRIRRFIHFSEGAARDAGLEPQQHQLLLGVRGLPADRLPTIAEIADRLQLAHNSAQELVKRTEQ